MPYIKRTAMYIPTALLSEQLHEMPFDMSFGIN